MLVQTIKRRKSDCVNINIQIDETRTSITLYIIFQAISIRHLIAVALVFGIRRDGLPQPTELRQLPGTIHRQAYR